MLEIEILEPASHQGHFQAPKDALIGKARGCDIQLDSWRVAKEHARLFSTAQGIMLEDRGAFSGVQINGTRIDNEYGPLSINDIIGIGPFRLRLKNPDMLPLEAPSSALASVESAIQPVTHSTASSKAIFSPHATAHTHTNLNHTDPQHAEKQHEESPFINKPTLSLDESHPTSSNTHQALNLEWRQRIHHLLIETMDLRRQDIHAMSDKRLRFETQQVINEILEGLGSDIPAFLDAKVLGKQVLDEAIGLGPLEELLEDSSISEIMVNRYDEIYVERAGRLEKHPLSFSGDRAVLGVIERIVTPLGRRIDEASPMIDARLKDGSRVNAIIPPLALKGPCLTIRKFSKRKLDVRDLVQFGSLSPQMAEFLQICVEARKNVIVSGGTGSGKTTLLNILSNFIPPHERIITIEDAAELQLHHAHLISLESRPANVEGKGAVPIRNLVKNTLRMRPDRIVVGECRGAEALDMLQAMNTGHEGSLTTLHANTPRDALARLETMIMMAGMELPLIAIREQIASAVDIIIQQTRLPCGTRLITHIVEITGMESGTLQMQELFRFVNQGYSPTHATESNSSTAPSKVRGYFTGCDRIPSFYDDLRALRSLDFHLFAPSSPSAHHHA